MSINLSSATWQCLTKPTSRPRQPCRRHQGRHLDVNQGRREKHSHVFIDIRANVVLKWKPHKPLLTWHATSLFSKSTSDFPGSTSNATWANGKIKLNSTSPLERMKLSAMWHCSSSYRLGVVDVAPSWHQFQPPKITKNCPCRRDVHTFLVMSPRVTACYTLWYLKGCKFGCLHVSRDMI